jgi:hypothetical protein
MRSWKLEVGNRSSELGTVNLPPQFSRNYLRKSAGKFAKICENFSGTLFQRGKRNEKLEMRNEK